ncbi:MAG: hypothetical protein AMJ95_05895 [Omnitrophica WOR_2 bacterium SM23_72]|nr:MAG: hypothetical protein AMJ95_05895 [Omnitrophica WOR_2 bacterium SM23_72]
MKRIEILFLVSALLLTIFLHLPYISGLYYEQDIALYANTTLEIARGKSLYSGFFRDWGNKPPLIHYIFLWAFSLLGPSFISIQIFALIAKILTVLLFYLMAKYLFAKEIKFYYLLPFFYALFSSYEGIMAHSSNLETFLIPFEITGILFLGLAAQNKRSIYYFLSGLALGLSFLIKQTGLTAYFAGFIFIIVLKILHRESVRVFLWRSLLFLSTSLVPFLLLVRYLFSQGTWGWFIIKVFMGSIAYIKNINIIRDIYMPWSIRQVWVGFKSEIVIFGFLALVGLMSSIIHFKKIQRLLALSWFLVTVFFFSRLGFHLRQHFMEILPPFLMLSVIGLSDIGQWTSSLLRKRRLFLRIVAVLGVLILVVPYSHVMKILIKRLRSDSFLLTQQYLQSADKERFVRGLLRESFDAGKRFLISQYIKERTTEKDRIFVWDDLATGSVYLWTQRPKVTSTCKFTFLPPELIGPIGAFLYRDPSFHDYRNYQERLVRALTILRPVYIVVIQSVLPMPNARPTYQYVLASEKQAFKDFFDLLDSDYVLEKEMWGCFAYRLKLQDAK